MDGGCWADTTWTCRHSAQEAPSSSSSSRCCCRAAPQTDSSSIPEPSGYPGCSSSRRRRRQRQRSTPGRRWQRWRLGCAACARWQSICGPAAAGHMGCCCCCSSRSWGSDGPWGAWLDPQRLPSPRAPQQQSAEAGSASRQHQAAPGGNAWSHGPHPSHTTPPAWAAARVGSSSYSSGGCRSSSRRSSRGSGGCQQDTAWGACVP